jgi:hypothetical protein
LGSKAGFTAESQRAQRLENWNAGIMESWNIGKRLETEDYWVSFAPIIPTFRYSIIPAGSAALW